MRRFPWAFACLNLAFLAIVLLFISRLEAFMGPEAVGPRFLLPVVVLLLYRLGQRLVAGPVLPRALLYATGGAGILMNLVVLNTTLTVLSGAVSVPSRAG